MPEHVGRQGAVISKEGNASPQMGVPAPGHQSWGRGSVSSVAQDQGR